MINQAFAASTIATRALRIVLITLKHQPYHQQPGSQRGPMVSIPSAFSDGTYGSISIHHTVSRDFPMEPPGTHLWQACKPPAVFCSERGITSELGKGNSKSCSSRRPHRISVNNVIVPLRWTNIESVDCFVRSSFVEHYLSKQLEKHLLSQPIVRGRRDIGWMVSVQIFEIGTVKHALLSAMEASDMRQRKDG